MELPANETTPIVLPSTGLAQSDGVAIDGAGNVYAVDTHYMASENEYTGRVIELPAGGGAQITLPFTGVQDPDNLAVDPAGDIIAESYFGEDLVELPVGGSQITLPFAQPCGSLTVDGLGDVFANGLQAGCGLLELPAGGGPEINIQGPSGILGDSPQCPAASASGFVFFSVYGLQQVAEVPASNQPGLTLASSPDSYSSPIAIDLAGDLFVEIQNNKTNIHTVERYQLSQSNPLNFGTTSVGSTTILPLTISDIGTATLTLSPAFDNPSFRILSMLPENCVAAIPIAGICTLQIAFTPQTAGSQNGTLTLTSNTATDPVVQLQGAAKGTAAPVFSPPSGVYAAAQTVSIAATPGAAIYYTTDGTVPTAASTPYTGPIAVSSTKRITAIATLPNFPAATASAVYSIAPASEAPGSLNFGAGFASASGKLQFNGTTGLDGTRLQLTNGGLSEEGSAFSTVAVNIQAFTTYFTFQQTAALADGLTFTIQNQASNALGGVGGYLGYEGIPESVALKFDLHDNDGEGNDSTGLYLDGAAPTVPAIDLTSTGIVLRSGDPMLAQIAYNGTNLALTITDTATFATWSHSFAVDIPATVGGDTAVVGFTAATGVLAANQEILSWTYVAGPPAALPPPLPIPALPGNSFGFSPLGLTTNGSASLAGTTLQLTDNGLSQAGSAFYANPLNIQAFTSDFTFQLGGANISQPLLSLEDGITFAIQNAGATALGDYGKALGYAPIGTSVAIKFDSHNDAGEGQDSTGLYVDGALPTVPSVNLAGTGINLHSGDPFAAHVVYNGATLAITLTDTVTLATWSHSFTIDIPATVGGNAAYVGFTGSTGALTSTQQVLDWSFTNP